MEGYHRQLRKVTKNKGVFPNDTALEKLVGHPLPGPLPDSDLKESRGDWKNPYFCEVTGASPLAKPALTQFSLRPQIVQHFIHEVHGCFHQVFTFILF